MRSSTFRSFRALVALVALALCAGLATFSAFTDLTESNDNAFESGYLSITDSNPDSDAVLDVTNVRDGQTGAACISVENDGTIAYSGLEVLRSAGVGELGEDISFTVTALDDEVSTAGADCAAFDSSSAAKRTVAGLSGTADTAASEPTSELAPLQEPGSIVSYKVAWAAELDNEDAGERVDSIKFRWNASQGAEATGGGQGEEEQPQEPPVSAPLAAVASTSLPTYAEFSINNIADLDDESTFWSNGIPGPGAFVQIDLGAVKTVTRYRYVMNAGDQRPVPQTAVAESSTDGQTWTALPGHTAGKVLDQQLDPSVQAQYLRIRVLGNTGEWWQVAGLNAYGY